MSLRDGVAGLWWGGRIEVCDAECAQHGGGALGAAGNATLGWRAIAEGDIDDADRLEGVQSFGGGEIEACGLELLFDCAMDEEGSAATKMWASTRWSLR